MLVFVFLLTNFNKLIAPGRSEVEFRNIDRDRTSIACVHLSRLSPPTILKLEG